VSQLSSTLHTVVLAQAKIQTQLEAMHSRLGDISNNTIRTVTAIAPTSDDQEVHNSSGVHTRRVSCSVPTAIRRSLWYKHKRDHMGTAMEFPVDFKYLSNICVIIIDVLCPGAQVTRSSGGYRYRYRYRYRSVCLLACQNVGMSEC